MYNDFLPFCFNKLLTKKEDAELSFFPGIGFCLYPKAFKIFLIMTAV